MDQILYMQAGIANLYMKKRKLSPMEFLKLDKKVDILGFIREGYDLFHLMGDKGILNEIDEYVCIKSPRGKRGAGKPAALPKT
jgi:hypothetical protein